MKSASRTPRNITMYSIQFGIMTRTLSLLFSPTRFLNASPSPRLISWTWLNVNDLPEAPQVFNIETSTNIIKDFEIYWMYIDTFSYNIVSLPRIWNASSEETYPVVSKIALWVEILSMMVLIVSWKVSKLLLNHKNSFLTTCKIICRKLKA